MSCWDTDKRAIPVDKSCFSYVIEDAEASRTLPDYFSDVILELYRMSTTKPEVVITMRRYVIEIQCRRPDIGFQGLKLDIGRCSIDFGR